MDRKGKKRVFSDGINTYFRSKIREAKKYLASLSSLEDFHEQKEEKLQNKGERSLNVHEKCKYRHS